MIEQIPIAIIIAAVAGLLRSVSGWLENSLKDGVVTDYEYQQLAGTVVKYVAAVLLLMLGVDAVLPVLGVNPEIVTSVSAPASVSGAFVLDTLTSALKTMSTDSGISTSDQS